MHAKWLGEVLLRMFGQTPSFDQSEAYIKLARSRVELHAVTAAALSAVEKINADVTRSIAFNVASLTVTLTFFSSGKPMSVEGLVAVLALVERQRESFDFLCKTINSAIVTAVKMKEDVSIISDDNAFGRDFEMIAKMADIFIERALHLRFVADGIRTVIEREIVGIQAVMEKTSTTFSIDDRCDELLAECLIANKRKPPLP